MAAMFNKGFIKPLIFTLLCLVHFTKAHLDANKLKEMKMKVEELQQRNDKMKEEFVSAFSGLPELMDEGVELTELLAEYMKLIDVPPGFPSFHGYMEKLRKYVWNAKDLTDSKMEEFGGKILHNDERLEKLRQLINFLEERHTEL